ncbi:ankyrin repeat domain-containing protein [Leptospira jelokensis]|uniref:Ankyrin repeat domain-containing protein n=1 Tax=Leptospira jelokensis TaxID=2484931 RepID=A0A4Z0ZRL4_9LEPT|nr:ankyrin repeat domain-containing protein [Leptospira jelokensis]TGL65379.1 ankyrin repeat domain-containing protein [Leptospira jelokensis]
MVIPSIRIITITNLILFLLLQTNRMDANDLNLSQMRDPKTIKEKVNKGFDVNTKRSEDGYTLLHYAAELGNVDLTKFLIAKGASLNVPMKDGNTPLAIAISFSKNEIIRLLLEQGVDPNYALGEKNYNRTHFHYFMTKVRKFDPSLFALFLTKGANLETKDSFTETPLITLASSEFKFIDHTKALLDAGANTNAQTKFGVTALMNSIFSRNFVLVEELIRRGANLELETSEGNTALLAMINMGNDHLEKPKLFQMLLDAKANVNHKNFEGSTALHLSVIGNSLEILTILSQQNVDSSIKNNKGVTALDQAIINENWQATKILLTIEKDIDGLDKYGSTKLHSAILNEKYELIQLLLDAGADPQKKDKWGKTAIEFAERQNNPKVLKLLLKE